MAKRLSSLFSLSRDNVGSDGVPYAAGPSLQQDNKIDSANQNISPTKTRFSKPKFPIFSDLNKPTNDPALLSLAPPPLLTEMGLPRPPSSVGSGSRPGSRQGSRPDSRASSGQSREESRSRPQTPTLALPPGSTGSPGRMESPSSGRLNKRRSWLPGKADKHKTEHSHGSSKAWIAGIHEHIPYDASPLLKGEKVDDVWNERGDTFIHLYPRSTRRGPSFKIPSSLFKDSKALNQLRAQAPPTDRPTNGGSFDLQKAQSDLTGLSLGENQSYSKTGPPSSYRMSTNFSVPTITPTTSGERHVYIPLDFDEDLSSPESQPQGDDLELAILYRNFFAFLLGGALIATPRQSSLFVIFMGISSILKRFTFTNADGSTWGDVPAHSFTRYCEELRLADVRSSREKTIEAILLGEQMRSWTLYNEGFVHASGRLDDIKSIKSAKFNKISPITINRLERAHIDVEQRLLILNTKLQDFDFPSMFAGIANSQTSTEAKVIRFKAWKAAFVDFRRFTVAYYRRKYGAWPPKASSKKNNFEESGLNRVLLKELYKDFTDLYDMLVDQSSLTPRTADMPPMSLDAESSDINESIQHALRRVEGEYDRATPPVNPPIPFDTPIIPTFAQSFNRNHAVTPKNLAMTTRPLTDNEVNEVLMGSYNRESIQASTWIQDFIAYERRLGSGGKTLNEVIDLRCGQWLFLYAILQSLPMTVVDARDVRYTEGVEYFLCIPPRGGRPWLKEDSLQSRAWYNVASGGGLVSLPADQIDHSVEGVYRRSHCWTVATQWAAALQENLASPVADNVSPISAPFDPPHLPLPSAINNPISYKRGSPQRSPAVSRHNSPAGSPMLRPVSNSAVEGRLSRSSNPSSGSLSLGLEAVAAPTEHQQQRQRPVSVFNPNITFDDILGTSGQQTGKKGKK